MTKPSKNFDSVETEDQTTTRTSALDFASHNPHPLRGGEANNHTRYKPTPSVGNPKLTAADVDDVSDVTGVADPFVRRVGSEYIIYHEVITSSGAERISLTTTPDLLAADWSYQGVALNPADHSTNRYAYPLFWRWDGTWYMTPDGGGDVYLYESDADPYPTASTDWTETAWLTTSNTLHDPTPFYYPPTESGRWYLVAGDATDNQNRLWYQDNPSGGFDAPSSVSSWSEHPSSPIAARAEPLDGPAGRPQVGPNFVDLYFKGGGKVSRKRIYELSTSTFTWGDTYSCVMGSEEGDFWFDSPHHVDEINGIAGTNLAIADGSNVADSWQMGVLTETSAPYFTGQANLNSSQSVNHDNLTQVQFDSQLQDYGQHFDKGTYEVTIPEEGYYNFFIGIEFQNLPASPTNGYPFNVRIEARDFNAGVTYQAKNKAVTTDGFAGEQTVEGEWKRIRLDGGETIGVRMRQQSGDTLDLRTGNYATQFSWSRAEP